MIIGTLAAGDGTSTDFVVQNLPQILVVGNSGQKQDIEGLVITVDGTVIQRVELGNEDILDTIAQLGHNVIDGANNLNSSYFVVGNGYLENVDCTIRMTNADAAATPTVYGLSFNQVSRSQFNPNEMNTDVVLQSKEKIVPGITFDYLVMDDANYSAADILFTNGYSMSQLSETELKTILSVFGNVPANIEDDNQIAIDNTRGNIAEIKLYASAGGNMDYVVIKA